MIALYEKYKLIIFSLLLFLCIFISIFSFVKYKERKYNQLYYTYGFVLLSTGLVITIVKIIIGMGRILFPIALPFAIIGLILVTIGEIKERRRK